ISTGDEIEELSNAFCQMAHKLKKSISDNNKAAEDNRRIATELSKARSIQEGLLPMAFPQSAVSSSYEVYAVTETAESGSSVFSDFYMVDKERLAITMAEVSEKGTPAALLKIIAKNIMKNNAMEAVHSSSSDKTDWGKVVEQSIRQLCGDTDKNMSLKVFFGILNIATGELAYVNGGQNIVLIGRMSEKEAHWQYIGDEKETSVSGEVGNVIYEEKRISLCHGDMLYCCADGVIDAVGEDGKPYSRERLQETLNRLTSSGSQIKEILADLRAGIAFNSKKEELSDGTTMLGLRYL
ncbi:MAG: SpoIIE family protein phosphatase, partial [Selenomonadaceae bacterium]|nr:SpoIIE family protein phosphatase [Selenomonadaceae bacterium]